MYRDSNITAVYSQHENGHFIQCVCVYADVNILELLFL